MFNFFQSSSLFNFFFTAFAVVLTLLYLIYAIVIYSQTRIMLKTLIVDRGQIFRFISLFQIFVAVLLLLLAFGMI